MNNVYVLLDDQDKPFMVCTSKEDAQSIVNNMFGKSLAVFNKHVVCTSFLDKSNRSIDIKNLDDIIHIAVQIMFEAHQKYNDAINVKTT